MPWGTGIRNRLQTFDLGPTSLRPVIKASAIVVDSEKKLSTHKGTSIKNKAV